MYKTIFLSGPHGSGKTSFINTLIEKYPKFKKNNFEIDFLKEYPSMPNMNMFERCLLRLYHRFYTAELTEKISKDTDSIILVDRGIHDSLAYSNVEYGLGEMDAAHHNLLIQIGNTCVDMLKPYTIILNPPVDVIMDRLHKRKLEGTRPEREILCAREDTQEYVERIHNEFEKFKNEKNVLYLTDNDLTAEALVTEWLKSL